MGRAYAGPDCRGSHPAVWMEDQSWAHSFLGLPRALTVSAVATRRKIGDTFDTVSDTERDRDTITVPVRAARRSPWLWPPVVIATLAVANWADLTTNWLATVASLAGAGTVASYLVHRKSGRRDEGVN
jgi:hypothetical protein